MSNRHFVCCTTDIRYDGRVYSLINTLSQAFPNEKIHIYNLIDKNIQISFPLPNIIYHRIGFLIKYFPESRVIRLLSCCGYALFVFFNLLIYRPRTVQVHHEGVLLAPYFYKLLFRSSVLVFDDKELYHPRDHNIPRFLYRLEIGVIKLANLVIFTNNERQRAVKLILHRERIPHLIIYNFVFNNNVVDLDLTIKERIEQIREDGFKILLHQGALSNIRGRDNIKNIIEKAPEEWKICFIGIKEKEFEDLKLSLKEEFRRKIINIGYISYDQLNAFWQQVDAAIMFYDACNFNNKYCAPNRLYLAVNNGIPFIGNTDNFTLSSFINKNNNGVLIPPNKNIDYFFSNYRVIREKALLLVNKFNYNDNLLRDLLFYYYSLK